MESSCSFGKARSNTSISHLVDRSLICIVLSFLFFIFLLCEPCDNGYQYVVWVWVKPCSLHSAAPNHKQKCTVALLWLFISGPTPCRLQYLECTSGPSLFDFDQVIPFFGSKKIFPNLKCNFVLDLKGPHPEAQFQSAPSGVVLRYNVLSRCEL